ncbi:MAG: ABC transporter permease [Candidatus Omnitrophica bacterium]|nr:ABC transporter permease [Candidatus Omnitrophota bacterium]
MEDKKIKFQASSQEFFIYPLRGWQAINWRELWSYRELFYFLTWKEIKVRYKQTAIGIFWAIIQPFLTMVIFSLFFGKFAKIESEGVPYPVFVYLGLLPWTYFSQSLSRSTECLIGNSSLLRKIYFPRLIIPVSIGLSYLIDFLIAFVILFGVMFYYQFVPQKAIVFMPILIIQTFLCGVGFGFWLSALNVLYRDVRYVVPFLLQIWLFVTPVIYPVSLVDENWRWILSLNPLWGLVEGYRALVIADKPIPYAALGVSAVIILFILITGVYFFRRVEKHFADLV